MYSTLFLFVHCTVYTMTIIFKDTLCRGILFLIVSDVEPHRIEAQNGQAIRPAENLKGKKDTI